MGAQNTLPESSQADPNGWTKYQSQKAQYNDLKQKGKDLASKRTNFTSRLPEYSNYLDKLKSRGYNEQTAYRLLKRKMESDGVNDDFVNARASGVLVDDHGRTYQQGTYNSYVDWYQPDAIKTSETDPSNALGEWNTTQTANETRLTNLEKNGLNWNRWTDQDKKDYLTMTDNINLVDKTKFNPMTVVNPSSGIQTGINNSSSPTNSAQPPK